MRGVVTHRPPDVPHGMLKRVGVLPSVHLRSRVRGCKRKNARTKMPLLLAAAGIRLVSDLQLGAADTHMDHARCGWSVEAWTLLQRGMQPPLRTESQPSSPLGCIFGMDCMHIFGIHAYIRHACNIAGDQREASPLGCAS